MKLQRVLIASLAGVALLIGSTGCGIGRVNGPRYPASKTLVGKPYKMWEIASEPAPAASASEAPAPTN